MYRIFGVHITLSARKGTGIGVPSVAIQRWLGTWRDDSARIPTPGGMTSRGFWPCIDNPECICIQAVGL